MFKIYPLHTTATGCAFPANLPDDFAKTVQQGSMRETNANCGGLDHGIIRVRAEGGGIIGEIIEHGYIGENKKAKL